MDLRTDVRGRNGADGINGTLRKQAEIMEKTNPGRMKNK